MGTSKPKQAVAAALFGKGRRAVLAFLFCHSEKAFYLRQIVRAADVGQGAVQRELSRLLEAGLVTRRKEGCQVYYQANVQSPVFPELRSLMLKTVGLADVLRGALTPLSGRIMVAFVYGSFAKGTEGSNSDVDLIIVGDLTLREAVSVLRPAQQSLGREINPTVYPVAEFRDKLAAGHHFLNTLRREPKIFIWGDEDELGRLA